MVHGWTKVYRMQRILEEAPRILSRVWKRLAAGGLLILQEGHAIPTVLDGRRLPPEVERALAARIPLRFCVGSGVTWWVRLADSASGPRLRLAAWGRGPGEWGHLLQNWVDLLSLALAFPDARRGPVADNVEVAWERLALLYSLGRISGGQEELLEALSSACRRLAGAVPADEVFMVLWGPEGWRSISASGAELPQAEALATAVSKGHRVLNRRELEAQAPLDGWGDPGQDLLMAPLPSDMTGEGVLGMIGLPGQPFGPDGVRQLSAAVQEIVYLTETARALEQSGAHRHFESDLAAEIQTSLLPPSIPAIPRLDLAAFLRPALRIGGDFYDVAQSAGDGLAIILGDVAGKGSPAAIVTAGVHGAFQGESQRYADPADLLLGMNRALSPQLEEAETFVTAVVARLRSEPLSVAFASAGHVDSVLWHASEERLELLPATGLPLGISPQASYGSRRFNLQPGDVLVLYSDGVTEAEDPHGKVLGIQGLADILYACHPARAADQVRTIVQALTVHRRSLTLRDDVVLLLVRAVPDQAEREQVVPFVYYAEPAAAGRAVDLVRSEVDGLDWLQQEMRRRLRDDFATAVAEVIANQAEHAFARQGGRLQGRLVMRRNALEADLYDSGLPFQGMAGMPLEVDPSDPPIRGYGLQLVRGLVDVFEYRRLDGSRNHWHLALNIPGGKGDEN
jgi:serine phosphatase RsbU (regulator of sigma subunit)/anti-sigma regulatory factor (Ser/Thr protein kinase)